MADNYVQILVTSKDDAKPDLDALKARLDELKSEVATARATVDDADAAAKLDALSAKLTSLGSKTANPKISMSGALSAEAQIHAVEAAMQKLDTTAADGGTGWKSRAASFAGAAASLTGLGDAMTAANPEASMFQKVMAGAGLATGLFEPVVAGATVAAGGLASGLVSAGAGLGVFAMVAKGAYAQAQTALQSYNAAQSTTGKAAAKDMQKYQAELAALPPSQQAFVKSIEGAQNAWQNFVASNTAGVTQILDKGLGLLPKILSAVQPLLAPTEKALSDIISKLSKGLDSSGFKSFMDTLAQNTGPAIEKIATAIGHVVVGIGGILKAFMPVSQGMLSGIDQITAKFAQWGSTLSQHSGFQSLMSTFKTETPIAMGILKNLLEVLKNVGSAMAGLATGSNSKTLLQVLEPLSGILAKLSANQDLVRMALYLLAAADAGKKLNNAITGLKTGFDTIKSVAGAASSLQKGFTDAEAAASDATGVWGTFGGKISTAITAIKEWGIWSKIAGAATKVWTGIQAAFDVVMAANPIVLVVIAVAALVAAVVLAYTHFQTFRTIVNDVGNAIKTGFVAAFNFVKTAVTSAVSAISSVITGGFNGFLSIVTTVWNGIKSITNTVWSWIKSFVSSTGSAISGVISSAFNGFLSVITNAWNAVKSATSTVWSAIQGAVSAAVDAVKSVLNWFASLGSLFTGWWNSGLSAVESVVGTMISFVSGVPGKILSALGNLGSLLFNAGASIIQGLINGIASMISSLGNYVGQIGSYIASLKGPLPKDLTLLVPHGQAIMTGLMSGIASQMPALKGQLAGISSTVAGTKVGAPGAAATGAGGGAAGNSGTLQLELTSSGDQFLIWLRNSIRIKGGNVQTVIGTG